METCANCGGNIGALETPWLWQGNIVCRKCYDVLGPAKAAYIPPPPPINSVPKSSARKRIGYFGVASLLLGILAFFMANIPPDGALSNQVGLFGLVLGIIGATLSVIKKRTFPVMPMAGAMMCAIALGTENGFLDELSARIRWSLSSAPIVANQSPPEFDPEPITIPPSLLAAEKAIEKKPDFSVSMEDMGQQTVLDDTYVITNESTNLLTINKVTYNGEYSAGLGKSNETGTYVVPDDKGFPKTISIGESAYILYAYPTFVMHSYRYPKTVVFIEVYTNLGTFKFNGSGVFMEKE